MRRDSRLPMSLAFLLAVLCACAGPLPVSTNFDSSGGLVAVEILGDGFVRADDRRIPLEAFVLELRQATRRMQAERLLRFVVRVRLTANFDDRAMAQMASDGREYLVKQLQIMGVRQLDL